MPDSLSPHLLIVSVKRSISKHHARSQSHSMHMYSTPQERLPDQHPSAFREPLSPPVPTVEQIAMGLHVSRTPHLRHHSRSSSHSPRSSSPPTPAIPLRSSLKKSPLASSASESSPALHTLPLPTSASASTSTITSASLHMIPGTASAVNMPITASPIPPRLQHNAGPGNALTALKLRMAKLLPGERKRSVSSPPLVISTDSPQQKVARKAVRFETLAETDQ